MGKRSLEKIKLEVEEKLVFLKWKLDGLGIILILKVFELMSFPLYNSFV